MIRLILTLFIVVYGLNASAGGRFNSGYLCSDAGKYCVSSGEREVQGFKISRDCWEWAYVKQCNYPSKNDCNKYGHCYSLGQRDCLMRDSMGNCVNIKKEFSCKRWTPTVVENEEIRYGAENKQGEKGLVCEGVPCIDGNCLDKSYEMDADMVSSIAQLGALSQGKSDGVNFKIFEGVGRHCTKKPVDYHNCCKVFPKGWGKNLGAKCSKDEQILAEKRQANLCVYAAKESKKTAGITTLIKHHYCCFSNIIEKVVQVEARKQLGMSFRKGNGPDCRGLTIEELSRVDFSKMDFSEVAAEVRKKVVMPDIEDVEDRINSAFKTTRRFDEERPAIVENKLAGINQSLLGPTEEEKRIEQERLERERQEELAQIEAEKQRKAEVERLAKIEAERKEKERLIKLAQDKRISHLNNLKNRKIVDSSEVEKLLEQERAYHNLHYSSWTSGGAPDLAYIAGEKCKLSLVRQKFLNGTKTRLEKEIGDIESEFSEVLLPDQISIKREAKQAELNVVKSELAKANADRKHNSRWNTGFALSESQERVKHYQKEVNRLEQELLEEDY